MSDDHSARSGGGLPHGDTAERRGARLAEARGRGTALVLVDLQNDYCHPDGAFARAGLRVADLPALIDATRRLTSAARAAGWPVIWTTTIWDSTADLGLLAKRSPFLAQDGLRRGTWGAQVLDELAPEPGDVIVEKRRFSAFHETTLVAELAEAGADTLVVGGVRTDFCVESTVRDAFFRDLDVFIVPEAIAGYIPELHEHSLRLMSTVFAQPITTDEATGLMAAASH